MTKNELLFKTTQLKELQNLQEQIKAQAESLKEEIKQEMTERSLQKLIIGPFKISYTKYTSQRFDSTRFKAENEHLYNLYKKPVETSYFTIS